MRKKELYNKVIEYFQKALPVAETELHYENPFQLLVAVILSAQCTDKRVNMITPPLFHDYPTPEAMAESTPEVMFEYIQVHQCGNHIPAYVEGLQYKLQMVIHIIKERQTVFVEYGTVSMKQLVYLLLQRQDTLLDKSVVSSVSLNAVYARSIVFVGR